MLVPDRETAEAFATSVDPMIDMALNLRIQNGQLVAARDALLPKLISGQIDLAGIPLPDEIAV